MQRVALVWLSTVVWFLAACHGGAATTTFAIELGAASTHLSPHGTLTLTAASRDADGRAIPLDAVAWATSDDAIASVTASGAVATVTAHAPGRVTITATAGARTAAVDLVVDPRTLIAIAIEPTSPHVPLGRGATLTATATYDDATTADVTAAATWTVADPAIARVDGAGALTGLALGRTQVDATIGPIAGHVTLVVDAAVLVALAIDPPTASLAKGRTRAFTATGTFSDHATRDLTASVTWTSTAPTIASVDATGAVTAVGLGAATVRATDAATGLAATATVTVTAAELQAIAVTAIEHDDMVAGATAIPKGTTRRFVATATYTDATTADVTTQVAWSIADPAIATVAGAGVDAGTVRGVAVGTTQLVARDPTTGIAGSATITVTSATLTALAVTPTTPSIAAGATQAFAAIGTFSDASTADLTQAVTWSSGSPTVATVSNAAGARGVATGVAPGTATIRATDPASGLASDTRLTVTAAALVAIALAPTSPSLPKGTTVALAATGTYTDGSTRDLTASATWSSSDPGIASVSNVTRGTATGLAVGAATITATDPASGIAGSTPITVTAATVASLAITPPTASIAKGARQAFVATATYTDATTQDVTASVRWTSSQPAVAAISNAAGTQGLATGASLGTTTITATVPGTSTTATATLAVTAATIASIAITPALPSVAKGSSLAFVATGTYSDGTTQDITAAVTWSSSAPSVATISNASGAYGRATAVDTGQTTITATMPFTTVTGATTLTVTAAALQALAIAPTAPAIARGTTIAFTATGLYSDGSAQDLTASVAWSSSDPAIATIAPSGLATGAGVGQATITATVGAIAIGTTLTVTAAQLARLQIDPPSPSLAAGTTLQLRATGTYTDGTTQDLTPSVTWSSSAMAVAQVSNASGSVGRATALAAGTTAITATAGAGASTALSTTVTLVVTAATLATLDIAPSDPTLPRGSTTAFTATGAFTDGTTQDLTAAVTWTSSDPTIATVSNGGATRGVVTTLAAGTATITATDPATGVSDTSVVTVSAATLVGVAIAPADATIAKGTTLALAAIASYSDGSTQDVTNRAVWRSSDDAIATVATAASTITGVAPGLATARDVGTVKITATVDGVTASTALTVTAATLVRIDVSPALARAPRFVTVDFAATGVYSDATTQDLTDSVTWSSSAVAVATISNAAVDAGTATTAAAGTTTITAADPASGIAGTATLVVLDATLTAIAVTPATATIADGARLRYTATGTYSDGTTHDVSAAVAWTSSKPAIASIGNNNRKRGIALGKKAGTVTITATAKGAAGATIAGTASLTVTSATLTSIEIAPVATSLPARTHQALTATGTFSDGSTSDVTAIVTWSSSAPAVATISNANYLEGVVTAVAPGTATMTARDPSTGLTATAAITVSTATPTALAITPATATLVDGFTLALVATATFSDGTRRDVTREVTWGSSDKRVVAVSNAVADRGTATALGTGVATIGAQLPQTTLAASATITATP